jgi:hypothetical protein
MGLRIEHRPHKGLNNRAENSHQPTRRRERIMKRFKSRHNGSWRFMIKSRTSSISHTPNPSLLTALRASKPSPSGARFRRSLPRSEESPLGLAEISASRFSLLKLTVPCVLLVFRDPPHRRSPPRSAWRLGLRGVKRIRLSALASNRAARTAYERSGYVVY